MAVDSPMNGLETQVRRQRRFGGEFNKCRKMDRAIYLGSPFLPTYTISDRYFVNITRTDFVKNIARSGGAIFADDSRVFTIECFSIGSKKSWIGGPDHNHTGEISCTNMQSNKVSSEGYGEDVGTTQRGFTCDLVFQDGNRRNISSNSSIALSNWRSGDPFPIVEVSTFDSFYQSPALTRTVNASSTYALTRAMQGYDAYVSARLQSRDSFLLNTLTANVVNGTNNISVGGVFARPENYSFHVWIGERTEVNVTVHVHVRECTINEQASLNETVCITCDANHYSFSLKGEDACRICPENGNCTSPFIVPHAGHWNAFPCSDKMQKCIREEACVGAASAAVMENLASISQTCDIPEDLTHGYRMALCENGYSGPLCGSCTDDKGRSAGFTCSDCQSTEISVGFISALVLIAISVVAYQIREHLKKIFRYAHSYI